ncbi:MAG: carbohydrate ABC transporter permease [Sphaerochaetaceae bacterium]|nr:carbohydrate ABC transporter permease [Spirochaetales bacterium]MDY5499742.1 carbohydrate ABC transporter permease [Sphaerochaetaceae bacterium]
MLKSYHLHKTIWRVFWSVTIGLFAFAMIVPFLWMLSASMKHESDVMKLPIDWIPNYLYFNNYLNVWHIGREAATNYHFGLAYFNSLKIAGINLFGAVFTSTLAGYAFAKIPFRGRDKVFLLYLATMMVPSQVTLIPRFVIFNQLHLMGTHWPLILPMLVTITGTFLLRQYFMQVPNSLREAAIIDGASEFKTWSSIMVPIATPSMGALAMLDFLWNWNNYLDALVFLSNWRLYTIPVALTNFIEESLTEYGLLMAAASSALIPIFLVFLFGQRFFVKGIVAGAVKG